MNDFPGKKTKEAKKNYRKLWTFWNLRKVFCEVKDVEAANFWQKETDYRPIVFRNLFLKYLFFLVGDKINQKCHFCCKKIFKTWGFLQSNSFVFFGGFGLLGTSTGSPVDTSFGESCDDAKNASFAGAQNWAESMGFCLEGEGVFTLNHI